VSSYLVTAGMVILDPRGAHRLLQLAERGLKDLHRQGAGALDDDLRETLRHLAVAAELHEAEIEEARDGFRNRNLGTSDDGLPTPRPLTMTVQEAAKVIGCSEEFVRRRAADWGNKSQGRWQLNADAVTEYAAQRFAKSA